MLFSYFRYLASIKYEKETKLKDHFCFLNMIGSYKKSRPFIPKEFDHYIFSKNVYPILIPWLISFFPDWIIVKYIDKYLGHFFDYLQLLLLLTFSIIIFSNPLLVSLAGIIFIILPIFLRDVDRTFSISARAAGNLLISLMMVLIYFYLTEGSVYFFLAIAFTIALILLTHRFTTQVMIFLIISLSIFYSYLFLFSLLLGFVLALIMSYGKYINVLEGHISGLLMFIRLDERHNLVKGETDLMKLFKFLVNPIKNIKNIKNNLTYSLMLTPILIILPFYIVSIHLVPHTYLLKYSFFLSMIIVLCIFITSFKITRFLGQPERYLEYGILPLIMMNVYSIEKEPVIYFPIFLIAFIISILLNIRFLNSIKVFKEEEIVDKKNKSKLFRYLIGIKGSNFLIIPMNFSHEIIFKSGKDCLMYSGTIEFKKLDNLVDITYSYPFVDIGKSIQKYGIKYILIDRNDRQLGDEKFIKNINEQIKDYLKIYDDHGYEIYRVNGQ